jgi:hypothetical protein
MQTNKKKDFKVIEMEIIIIKNKNKNKIKIKFYLMIMTFLPFNEAYAKINIFAMYISYVCILLNHF